MAGKLRKLKTMLRRWHSSNRLADSAAAGKDLDHAWRQSSPTHHNRQAAPADLRPVYVGQSRRQYLISSDLVDHPLFQVLTQRSGELAGDNDGDGTVVGCEVVLFEHLLWMLENADPQPESLDELVEFYAC